MRTLLLSLAFVAYACSSSATVGTQSGSDAGADSAATPTPIVDSGADVALQGPPSTPFTPDAGACPDGWFLYDDTFGSAGPADAAPQSTPVGDGKCYRKCTADAECGGTHPACHVLGLFSRGDYNCNDSVLVCRPAETRDDCERPRP